MVIGRWSLAPGGLADRDARHEESILSGSKSPLPGVRGTWILRVARKPEGAEAMGTQRRLWHVSGDREDSVILAGERKNRSLGSEAALSLLVAPDGAQKVDAPEGGPVGVAEVVFAVGALPEQEAAQPDLAAGADDEVGVR